MAGGVGRREFESERPSISRLCLMQLPIARHALPHTIQEIQVFAPPQRQGYTGAPSGSQEDFSLNMYSQKSIKYTHRVARGDVAMGFAIPVSISATTAQSRAGQNTAADRVRAHWGAQHRWGAYAAPSEGRPPRRSQDQREVGT